MKGSHDIYIMKSGDGYRVRPAVWSSDAQDLPPDLPGGPRRPPKLCLRNLTDKQVLILLPPAILKDPADAMLLLDPVRQPGASVTDWKEVELAKKAKGEMPVAHPYSAFVIVNGVPVAAAGESEPVVIIDPPPV